MKKIHEGERRRYMKEKEDNTPKGEREEFIEVTPEYGIRVINMYLYLRAEV